MKKVYVYILLTALMFGSMEVACKIAGNSLDAFQLCFLRFLIGGLILLPVALIDIKNNDDIKLTKSSLAYCALCGFVGITVSMVLFQLGVMYCNASTAAVIICMTPVFTMIFTKCIKRERFDGISVGIIVLTLGAIVMMIRPWEIQEGNTVQGFIFMILAAVFFALYSVMGKKGMAELGSFAFTSFSFLAGCAVLFVIMLILDKPIVAGISDNWALLLYVGIVVTGLGYYCYFSAIKYSDAVTGSMAFVLKIAIAPIIAVVTIHETLLWNTIAGMIIAISASGLNVYNNKRKERDELQGDN